MAADNLNMPYPSKVQKQSQFNANQIQEIWKQTVMQMLTSTDIYILPKYATKVIQFEPNMGVGPIKIVMFKPFADDSWDEYGEDATAAGDPLKTASVHIEMNIKKVGCYTVGTRGLMVRDQFAAEWVDTYQQEFVRLVLMYREKEFKATLAGTDNSGASGASRFYSNTVTSGSINDGTLATRPNASAGGPRLKHLIAIRNKMHNHTIDSADTGKNVDAVIPGFNNGMGEYLVVHSQEFFDVISQDDTFRDLINKGFSNKEYVENDFSTYFGLRFKKMPRRWKIKDTGSPNTERDVAMVIGGSMGTEAIARLEFNHAYGLEYFHIQPPRTADNPMDLYKHLMGAMFYVGFKVLRPKAVYLYIYAQDGPTS